MRNVEDVSIEGRISMSNTPEDQWGAVLQGRRDLGATHVGFNTMGAGLASPQAHVDAIRRFKEAVDGQAAYLR